MVMIERVARAIYEHRNSARGGVWWGVDERDRLNVWYPLAYAAVKAMRELPDSMLESVGPMEGFYHEAYGGEEDRCHREWWAMVIDASLANYPVKPDSSTGRQGDSQS
jgi:hypothetical protein